jgi:hypothetical protein
MVVIVQPIRSLSRWLSENADLAFVSHSHQRLAGITINMRQQPYFELGDVWVRIGLYDPQNLGDAVHPTRVLIVEGWDTDYIPDFYFIGRQDLN